MRVLCGLIILFISFQAQAQGVLQNLKKAAGEKAKNLTSKENLDKAGQAALKNMDKARAEFDSTDFDWSQNASPSYAL